MPEKYTAKTVSFPSQGVTLAGMLFTPRSKQQDRKYPAVTFLGPYTFVKEMAPFQYAPRLAQLGYVTLIFDPRSHGASEGEPRRWESPFRKVEDVKAAIDYLQSLPQVNQDKIAIVGICMGAPTAAEAAVVEPRIKVLASIVGSYVDREMMVGMVGGEEEYKRRVKRAAEAKEKFQKTGQVDYIGIVDETDKSVAMPAIYIWNWYHGWPTHSSWENRMATMGEGDLLSWDAMKAAPKVKCSFILIGSEKSAFPHKQKAFFDLVNTEKHMAFMEEHTHLEFYDNPVAIDSAVDALDEFFGKHLGKAL